MVEVAVITMGLTRLDVPSCTASTMSASLNCTDVPLCSLRSLIASSTNVKTSTPVSTATPASAMKPTATATEMLKPFQYTSQKPPINAKGTDSITTAGAVTLRKFRYSSKKMIISVIGMTMRSLSAARSMYSYCPDQVSA